MSRSSSHSCEGFKCLTPQQHFSLPSPQQEGGSKSSTMTELETAMSMIIDVFARYSGAEGSKQSLTKGELKTLMEKELPGFLQTGRNKGAVDKLLKDLDANGDAEVDFSEFIVFVAALTSTCHKYFQQGGAK
uniref:S100 calcium binding protein P n=2 Tax=Equus TaxID=9789 RepID=F6Z563_HORSE